MYCGIRSCEIQRCVMIFDCPYVTELVERWKYTQDPKILDLILQHTTNLIEAIVSGYDSAHRDDLIQESYLRVQYALPFFNGRISNLHTYLTTVIKNICATYLRKQSRLSTELQVDMTMHGEIFEDRSMPESDDILDDLLVRNRLRFPSVDVCVIDELTERLYSDMTFSLSKRAIISNLVEISGCTRQFAVVVYTSSVIYLRSRYVSCADTTNAIIDVELSVIPDIEELIGTKAGALVCDVLTGMTVRFP